jgi:predicted transcriptional regulator
MSQPLSLRLDDQLAQQLTALARLTERSKTWHIEQALRDYLAREIQFIEAVEAGLQAEEAGDLADHGDVVAELDTIIAQARQKHAQ